MLLSQANSDTELATWSVDRLGLAPRWLPQDDEPGAQTHGQTHAQLTCARMRPGLAWPPDWLGHGGRPAGRQQAAACEPLCLCVRRSRSAVLRRQWWRWPSPAQGGEGVEEWDDCGAPVRKRGEEEEEAGEVSAQTAAARRARPRLSRKRVPMCVCARGAAEGKLVNRTWLCWRAFASAAAAAAAAATATTTTPAKERAGE